MRWRDEDGVWSTPGNFLDLAHEVGLTNDITALVLEETLASLDAINAAFGAEPAGSASTSPRAQACDARFMRKFPRRLAASGHAQRFMLEITEEAFLPSGQFQARVLPMIREIGAQISIDDFGSGFSSLATLADITADEVKVDRSLITDIDQRPRNQSLLAGHRVDRRGAGDGGDRRGRRDRRRTRLSARSHGDPRRAKGFYLGKPIVLPPSSGAPSVRALARTGARSGTARPRHSRTIERRSL